MDGTRFSYADANEIDVCGSLDQEIKLLCLIVTRFSVRLLGSWWSDDGNDVNGIRITRGGNLGLTV